MPSQRRRQYIVLREKEVAIVFVQPESRLQLALMALNAAGRVLLEGIKLGLISSIEGLEGFQRLAQSLLSIVIPSDKTKEN